MTLVQYDDEKDVEWVYDIDLDDNKEAYFEPGAEQMIVCIIKSVFEPIWQYTMF